MRSPSLITSAVGMVLLLALTAGCTRNLKEEKYTVDNARFKLLIAGDASEFKDRIRTRLIAYYKPYGNIEVVNIDKLQQVKADTYQAIVIMDTCLAWSRFNPSTKAFLDRLAHRDNVVVLMTANDTDWEFKYQGVDVMTSASAVENEDLVFDRLKAGIDRIVAAD